MWRGKKLEALKRGLYFSGPFPYYALAYARGLADEKEEEAENVGGELLTALRTELED